MVKLLACRALTFEYESGVRALAGVDLVLAAGELVVVLGPNGSGKSTLQKCCAGLLTPTSGAVELAGRSLASFDARARAREVAVVPQFLPSLPDVGVEDFVLGGRYAHFERWSGPRRADELVAERALAECDALDLRGRLMSELSGGQRQRVVIARAVAQEARVLLVDEPTNSLDPEHQVRVFELLARLSREGRAALVATHELNLASQFATRLVLLDAGRVAASGTAEQLLRPEVLTPIYGEQLYFGRTADVSARPFVLPWARRGRDAG